MKHFLVVYERPTGKLLVDREFPDERQGEASAERLRLEKLYRDNPDIEVVLLGSESRETVVRTHGRYFQTPAQLAHQSREALDRVLETYKTHR